MCGCWSSTRRHDAFVLFSFLLFCLLFGFLLLGAVKRAQNDEAGSGSTQVYRQRNSLATNQIIEVCSSKFKKFDLSKNKSNGKKKQLNTVFK